MSASPQATPLARSVLAVRGWPQRQPFAFLAVAALGWWLAYRALVPLSEAIVARLPVDGASHLGAALQFFFYDAPEVLLLLTAVVFVMGMVNSYFTPERTRALLATVPRVWATCWRRASGS